MQLKHYSLLFSIAGIIILYFLSTLTQPIVIELSELPEYEDKQVTVEGVVAEHYITSYESQIIKIEGDNATAMVFVEEKSDVEYGDKIQVTGKVQKYKGDWEIVVGNERFVTILQKWQNISIPLWQIAENPVKYDGLNINVTGYIDAVYDAYFYLVDEEATHSIIVFYNSFEHGSVYSGQKVDIAAQFRYNPEDLRYKLDVMDETHGITLSGE